MTLIILHEIYNITGDSLASFTYKCAAEIQPIWKEIIPEIHISSNNIKWVIKAGRKCYFINSTC